MASWGFPGLLLGSATLSASKATGQCAQPGIRNVLLPSTNFFSPTFSCRICPSSTEPPPSPSLSLRSPHGDVASMLVFVCRMCRHARARVSVVSGLLVAASSAARIVYGSAFWSGPREVFLAPVVVFGLVAHNTALLIMSSSLCVKLSRWWQARKPFSVTLLASPKFMQCHTILVWLLRLPKYMHACQPACFRLVSLPLPQYRRTSMSCKDPAVFPHLDMYFTFSFFSIPSAPATLCCRTPPPVNDTPAGTPAPTIVDMAWPTSTCSAA